MKYGHSHSLTGTVDIKEQSERQSMFVGLYVQECKCLVDELGM